MGAQIHFRFASGPNASGPILKQVDTSHSKIPTDGKHRSTNGGPRPPRDPANKTFADAEGLYDAIQVLLRHLTTTPNELDHLDGAEAECPYSEADDGNELGRKTFHARKRKRGWYYALFGTDAEGNPIANLLFHSRQESVYIDTTEFRADNICFDLNDNRLASLEELRGLRRAIAEDRPYVPRRTFPPHIDDPWSNATAAMRACMKDPPLERLREIVGSGRRDSSDTKLVLHSREMSDALLDGGNRPALAEALANSTACVFQTDLDKDTPQLADWSFNHFITLTTVLGVIQPPSRTKHLVCYHRSSSASGSSNVHTQGRAMIWGLKGALLLTSYPLLPLDFWFMQIADFLTLSDEPQADSEAIGRATNQMIRYLMLPTLNIEDFRVVAQPLATITRDQRGPHPKRPNQECKRVYTSYVFEVILRPPKGRFRSVHECVRALPVGRRVTRVLGNRPGVEKEFHDGPDKPNIMDILAWRCLQSDAPDSGELDNARYDLLFDIVPPNGLYGGPPRHPDDGTQS